MPKQATERNYTFIAFCMLFSMALSITLFAGKPEISADKFESQDGKHVARGNAILTSDEAEIRSDTLIYDAANNTVSAEGNVQGMFTAGRIVSKKASYNIKDKSISAENFRMGRAPVFIKGEKLNGNLEHFSAENATIYYNEPAFMGINAKAGKLSFTKPGTVKLEDTVFRIGRIPVLYLPSYTQSTLDSPIDVKTQGGYRSNLGAYLHNKIYFPNINQSVQPGAEIAYFTKRGLLAGPAVRYNTDYANVISNGEFHSGFISDNGSKGVDLKNRFVDEKRHYLEWENKNYINDNTTLTAKLSWWSDSEVLRDFQPEIWKDNQQPDNFIEGVYAGDNYFISAFTRFDPNDWQRIQARAPELRFDLMPIQVADSNTWFDMHSSLASLYEKDSDGLLPEKNSDRADLYFGLRAPIKLDRAITITPVAGSRITHYEKTNGGSGNYTRALGQIGFDAQVTANRTWKYKNETWGIDGLRHIIRPMLQYRYIPEANKGDSFIPQIDRRFFSTLLPSIDLADIRNVDDMHELNVIRFGAENTLLTRSDEYGSRTLAALNVFQDYNFSTQPGSDDYSALHTEIELSPIHWFGFDIYNRFNPEHLTNQETRTRARISNGDVWELHLSTDNLQNSLDQYYVDYKLKLSERYYFVPRLRFDTKQNKISEQVYGLRTYLGNTWEVEYAVSYREGSSRENGLGMSVKLNVGSF